MDFFSKMMEFMVYIAAGYLAKRTGLVKERAMGVLSIIMLDVTLPCTITKGLNGYHLDARYLSLLVVGFVFNVLFIGVGHLLARRRELRMRGFCMLNSTGFNIGMFAMPFLQTFCTPAVFSMICLCDVGNAIMTMGGNYAVSARLSKAPGMNGKKMVKIVLTCVGFHCYIIMLTLSVLNISLPGTFMSVVSGVASVNPMLCMFMIGLGLKFRIGRDALRLVAKILSMRYLVAALLCAPLFFLPIDNRSIVVAMCIYLLSPVSGLNPIYTYKMAPDMLKDSSMNSCVSIMVSTAIFIVLVPALLMYAG